MKGVCVVYSLQLMDFFFLSSFIKRSFIIYRDKYGSSAVKVMHVSRALSLSLPLSDSHTHTQAKMRQNEITYWMGPL